jgi:iron complex outermembrane recepter protein
MYALGRLHEVRDQVVAPLELHVDLRERVLEAVPQRHQPVVDTDDTGIERELGSVTVTGDRPTSLPTQIPTTIEGITGDRMLELVNATDAPDALKYFPSLLVRKRYVGDFDHAVLATRASGTGNSARSLVFADGILLSNLLGNSNAFTPRWGMVSPEEIDRVDVLYGPFSAAYQGNSVGAVVDFVTRMPEDREISARVGTFRQDFNRFGTDDSFDGWQASASVGDRHGSFAWRVDFSRLDSSSPPMVFANKLLSAGTVATTGTPVTGAFLGVRNPRRLDWTIIGSTSLIDTVQDQGKAKLSWDFESGARLSYVLGLWVNDVDRSAESYLRDAAGNQVFSGAVNIGGRRYTLLATDFNPSRAEQTHVMHGLSLRSKRGGTLDWELAASLYDYGKDSSWAPTIFLPQAATGGAGRVTDQSGTGWNTLSARGTWRPGARDGAHIVEFGAQRGAYQLRTLVSNVANWLGGAPTSRFSEFRGETDLTGVYLQDTWRFAPRWRTTLGLRAERWTADSGSISNATTTLRFGERSETWLSPKAALAFQLTDAWALKASVGRAIRTPTVSELYQGSIAVDAIVNNDPDLAPERSWTSELTAERELAGGTLRVTGFHETTRDALYSQTNVTLTVPVTNIQNVDRIRTNGIETAFSYAGLADGRLEVGASATYTRSRIVRNDNFPASVGKWQPRVPDWRANVYGTFGITPAWSVSFGARDASCASSGTIRSGTRASGGLGSTRAWASATPMRPTGAASRC